MCELNIKPSALETIKSLQFRDGHKKKHDDSFNPYDSYIAHIINDTKNVDENFYLDDVPNHCYQIIKYENKIESVNVGDGDAIDGFLPSFEDIILKIKESVKEIKAYIKDKVTNQKKYFNELFTQAEEVSRQLHYMWECEMDTNDDKTMLRCVKLVWAMILNVKKMISNSYN